MNKQAKRESLTDTSISLGFIKKQALENENVRHKLKHFHSND